MSGIVTQCFIFLVIWWLTLFVVLPWGVRRSENADSGHDPGAPSNPMLLRKALVTTVIALAIWGAAFITTHVFGLSIMQLVEMVGL